MMSKKDRLFQIIRDTGPMLIAFSGGVDSSLLLAAAHEAGSPGIVAATAVSDIHPRRERHAAEGFTRERRIPHLLVPTKVTDLEVFSANRPDRCYHCKRHLFELLCRLAQERRRYHVAHGANLDDLNDYRPGMKAAQDFGIRAPLIEAGLGKGDVRSLAREMGLSSWEKPAMACLATRIPYGTPITTTRLNMIERAEGFLVDVGLGQCRVRHHGDLARIELNEEDMARIMHRNVRNRIVARLMGIGFSYVTLDLEGYISGRMNRNVDLDLISRHKGVAS